jgi:glyoxylase-like metal-dependent hydrolase (beta-lactamase superfamily II)
MSSTIADKWYEVHAVSDGISLIRETHVATWLRCNMWHVRGRDHDLLIDTGMGVRPLKAEVSLLRQRPVTCIATHAHFDHIGAQHEFERRLGHPSESDIHAAPTRENSADWGPFVRAETFSALPDANFDYRQYAVTPAPLTGYLDEGDVVDLGDRVFQVLHLPGHSPGSIALYEQSTGTLFSGDTIYDGALYDTVYHSDRTLYRQSLERLRGLPVTTVHGGHDNSFGRERMLRLIDNYLAGKNTIEDPESWINDQIG